MKLTPNNFKRFPLGYRPRRTLRVPRNFGRKVKEIKKYGPRADDENIANVVTVLEDMKTYKPKLFYRRKKTMKKRV